jgi:hypothetical protein
LQILPCQLALDNNSQKWGGFIITLFSHGQLLTGGAGHGLLLRACRLDELRYSRQEKINPSPFHAIGVLIIFQF